MDILVIGGSYFLGRHFVEIAKENNTVTVFNRGTCPLQFPEITEIIGDRHDAAALLSILGRHFDAVVDFCAYTKGDIEFVFKNIKSEFKQYIFISTCDVYERGLGKILDENAPFEYRSFEGEAGDYISGKVALEEELLACEEETGIRCTSIRPAFIYGPYNYAPREGIYFHWIKNAGQILYPYDATGEFQMVYVKDAAKSVLNSINAQDEIFRAYNLSPLPMITYDSFASALQEAEKTPFTLVKMSVEDAAERQIPFPFPLTKQESNFYDGNAALRLIGSYTSLTEGLKETAEWLDTVND